MRQMAFPFLVGLTTTAFNRRIQASAFHHGGMKLWGSYRRCGVKRPLPISSSTKSFRRYTTTSSSLDDLMENVNAYFAAAAAISETKNHTNGWRHISWEDTVCTTSLESFQQEFEEYLSVVAYGGLRPKPTSTPSSDGTSNFIIPPSPVEAVLVRDRLVFLKRDDLLRLPHSHVSGNKARKLYALNQIPPDQFPECIVSHGGPQSNAMLALAAIVRSKNVQLEHGSSDAIVVEDLIHEELHFLDNNYINEDSLASSWATSSRLENNMAEASDSDEIVPLEPSSLPPPAAATAGKKRFVYYTKKLPKTLRTQPSGNLFRAQLLGIELVELNPKEYDDWFGSEWGGRSEPPPSIAPPVPGNSVWIPQGGACGLALAGARNLALEVLAFWSRQGHGRPLSVCLPGGTCTTALLLHRELQTLQQQKLQQQQKSLDIRVVVVPCVGDDAYARRQMMSLNSQMGGRAHDDIPTVLPPSPSIDAPSYLGQPLERQAKYFSFGTPHAAILNTFIELRDECRVVLDLLYGAPSWTILLRHWRATAAAAASSSNKEESNHSRLEENHPLDGRELMYIHSGGLEGIGSQLLRYKHKGLVDLEQIQLPGRVKSKGR